MKKIIAVLILIPLNALSVDGSNKVHEFCEVKYKSQADLVAKISNMRNAQLCIKIVKYCSQAEGKVYFDNSSSATPVYISKYDSTCM